MALVEERRLTEPVKLTNSAIAFEFVLVDRKLHALVRDYWSALFAAYL